MGVLLGIKWKREDGGLKKIFRLLDSYVITRWKQSYLINTEFVQKSTNKSCLEISGSQKPSQLPRGSDVIHLGGEPTTTTLLHWHNL